MALKTLGYMIFYTYFIQLDKKSILFAIFTHFLTYFF